MPGGETSVEPAVGREAVQATNGLVGTNSLQVFAQTPSVFTFSSPSPYQPINRSSAHIGDCRRHKNWLVFVTAFDEQQASIH
jgi:hypothetical protein